MRNDKMREEFEVWARKMSMDLEYRNIPGVGQFYECPRTLLALEAWHASREALVIELPPVQMAQRSDEEATFSAGGNDMRRKTIKMIEAAGLKVSQ